MAQRATEKLTHAAKHAAKLAQQRIEARVPDATAYWRRVMERNKRHVQQREPKELAKDLVFTSLARAEERVPVRVAHFQQELDAVKVAARNWRELPLVTVAKTGVFSAECFAWFCVGEIIGRGGSLTGYDY